MQFPRSTVYFTSTFIFYSLFFFLFLSAGNQTVQIQPSESATAVVTGVFNLRYKSVLEPRRRLMSIYIYIYIYPCETLNEKRKKKYSFSKTIIAKRIRTLRSRFLGCEQGDFKKLLEWILYPESEATPTPSYHGQNKTLAYIEEKVVIPPHAL